ncbi:MAG TPA: DUF72 domain-containing protein [Usitatibacter sp.]|nr:DUF72 domain-containing protein [Usitatibacter sp.]
MDAVSPGTGGPLPTARAGRARARDLPVVVRRPRAAAGPRAGRLRIGISGWRYEPWRKVFYPQDLAQHRELQYASRQLPTIEINGTFYSLQRPECFEAWHGDTPEGFVFAVKGSRFITHMKKLRDVERPLANFFASGIFNLRGKLGPFLWQFPPNFAFDAERLEAFFELLPRDLESALALARRRDARVKGRSCLKIDANRKLRHAIEIRHESFRDLAFVKLLRRHRIALVVADTAGKWPLVEDVTADFMYLRLHGDVVLYASGYSDEALDHWARRIHAWSRGAEPADARKIAPGLAPPPRRSRDVYCYFDNDMKVHAPFDARKLIAKLEALDADSRREAGHAASAGRGPAPGHRAPPSAGRAQAGLREP